MGNRDFKINQTVLSIFCINLILFSSLAIFAFPHFSIDSYCIYEKGYDAHCLTFVSSFRYIGALLDKIWFSLGGDPLTSPLIDTVIFIVITSISTTMLAVFLTHLPKKHEKLSVLSINREDSDRIRLAIIDCGVVLSLYNPWFINILTFPECILVSAFGNLLCFGAVIVYYSNHRIGQIIAAVLLICSIGIFQQFFVLFVIYVVIAHNMEMINETEENPRGHILWYLKTAVFLFSSLNIYYVLGKLVQKLMGVEQNSRVALDIRMIIDNIFYFLRHQHSYLKGRGYFKSEILTCCYLAIFVLWFASGILYFHKKHLKIYSLFLVVSCTIAYGSSFFMGLISTSHGVRTMFGLFSTFALFSITSLTIYFLFKCRRVLYPILGILILVLSMNIFKNLEMAQLQVSTNALEQLMAQQIIQEISLYEKNSGKKIQHIYFCSDTKNDLTVGESSLHVKYALQGLLYYVSGRNFNIAQMNTVDYNNFFSGKDWKVYLPEEQLHFREDTLFLCVF